MLFQVNNKANPQQTQIRSWYNYTLPIDVMLWGEFCWQIFYVKWRDFAVKFIRQKKRKGIFIAVGSFFLVRRLWYKVGRDSQCQYNWRLPKALEPLSVSCQLFSNFHPPFAFLSSLSRPPCLSVSDLQLCMMDNLWKAAVYLATGVWNKCVSTHASINKCVAECT